MAAASGGRTLVVVDADVHDDALGVGCMLSFVVRSLVDAKVCGLGTDNNQFPIVSYTSCLLKNWHGQSPGCIKTYFSMYMLSTSLSEHVRMQSQSFL